MHPLAGVDEKDSSATQDAPAGGPFFDCPTMAKKKAARQKKLDLDRASTLAAVLVEKQEQARQCYRDADQLIAELKKVAGRRWFDLDEGGRGRLVDNFTKTKAFRTVVIPRYELYREDDSGKQIK